MAFGKAACGLERSVVTGRFVVPVAAFAGAASAGTGAWRMPTACPAPARPRDVQRITQRCSAIAQVVTGTTGSGDLPASGGRVPPTHTCPRRLQTATGVAQRDDAIRLPLPTVVWCRRAVTSPTNSRAPLCGAIDAAAGWPIPRCSSVARMCAHAARGRVPARRRPTAAASLRQVPVGLAPGS